MPTRPESARRALLLLILALPALPLLLPACSGRPVAVEKSARIDSPLAQAYPIIVVEPVAISADAAKRHPKIARACQQAAIEALKAQNRFELVDHTAPRNPGKPVLLVRGRITDLRPPERGRTEPAYINMDVHLADAATGETAREKQLTVAPAEGAGTADELAHALGAALAEYLGAVVPNPRRNP